jgi:hypothetical protein
MLTLSLSRRSGARSSNAILKANFAKPSAWLWPLMIGFGFSA